MHSLPRAVYHDVMDCGWARIGRILRCPGDLLAVSETQYADLARVAPNRQIHLVPQHHCNFECELRPADKPVRRVGCIGGDSAVQWPHYAIERMLGEVGLEWEFCSSYHRRKRILEFYRRIDIQISWRPTHARGLVLHMNPLKLSNAGSFGIPTVAFPEPAYMQEWPKACVYADTITVLIAQVRMLAEDPAWYAEMAQRARERAADYHIDRIADLYRQLPGAA
jgi:hypothetical protein